MKSSKELAVGVIHPAEHEAGITAIINDTLIAAGLDIVEIKETILKEEEIDEFLSPVGHIKEYPALKAKYLAKPVCILVIKGNNVFETIKNLVTDNELFTGAFSFSTDEETTKNCLNLFFPCDNVSRKKSSVKKQ